MPTPQETAKFKKLKNQNPRKEGESVADYNKRIERLVAESMAGKEGETRSGAAEATEAQRREGQEKKKAKEEASRRDSKIDFKRDGILTRGSVYYTKDGKMVVAGTAPGNSVAPKEMYDRDGKLIYQNGKKVTGKNPGVVKRTDMPKKQEEKPKAQAAKPTTLEKVGKFAAEQAAKKRKAEAERKAKELQKEKDKVLAETKPMQRKDASVIKLAEPDTAEVRMTRRSVPKAEEKKLTRSEKRMVRRGESGKADKAMGRAEARKTKAQSKATVKETKQEVSKLKRQVAGAEKAAKAKSKADKRVSRAKSKKEQLEARLKALRS